MKKPPYGRFFYFQSTSLIFSKLIQGNILQSACLSDPRKAKAPVSWKLSEALLPVFSLRATPTMTRSLSHDLCTCARTSTPPPGNSVATVPKVAPTFACVPSLADGLGTNCEITGRSTESSKRRTERYSLQRQSCKVLAWQLTPKKKPYRIHNCQRAIGHGSQGVKILEGPGGARFGGLQTCGSVWTCAVCAEKISRYREAELARAMGIHMAGGGFCLMVTFTHSHARGDSLAGMVSAYRKAMSSMTSWRPFKDLRKSLGYFGKVSALETTYGDDSGWHPHGHELWLIKAQPDEAALEKLRLSIFVQWKKACIEQGLPPPNEKHGVAISYAESAAQYMAKANTTAKWTAAKEMTRGHFKTARGQRFAPFDLLRAMADGYRPEQMQALFREYAKAYHGRRQLRWSKGLKKAFEVPEVKDEEAAELPEATHKVAGTISIPDWRNRVLMQPVDRRLELLELFEREGMQAVAGLIATMPMRCRDPAPRWAAPDPDS
jgi:hypothetical protein